MDTFLKDVEIVQVGQSDLPEVLTRCIDLAGQMAQQLGAIVYVDEHFSCGDNFRCRGKRRVSQPVNTWLSDNEARLQIRGTLYPTDCDARANTVVVSCDALASEATLFAQSGLADLLGDPNRAPLIPRGDYAAGTAAYGVLSALCGLVAKHRRSGIADTADVDLGSVLAWVNWKAAAAGYMGKDIHREGDAAEWPVIACADGYVALVYQQRDWPNVVAMVDDTRLADERFQSYRSRAEHRIECLDLLRQWASKHTKAEILELFVEYDIPAAPVMTPTDLLSDPLLEHREAFVAVEGGRYTPRLAHRVATIQSGHFDCNDVDGDLPLSGIRVLDLGIITAGAGVSALLADLGAEVIKIESHTYPDPFRQWSGETDSPLFKCNNRNKYGVALDLKRPEDRTRFLDLVATADVVVENFRRGVLERLQLGYDVLSEANPGILLASISGQGLTGPGSGVSSFGSTLEASSGFASHVTYEEGVPYITGRNVNYPDQTVVLYAAAVISAALAQPQRGMHLDVAQRDVAVYLLGDRMEKEGSSAELDAGNGAAYATRDGHWLALDDNRLPDKIDAPNWIGERALHDAIQALGALGIGAAKAAAGSEMVAKSYTFEQSPDGAMVKGFPFQFRAQPMVVRLNSPSVGEHTDHFVSI